MTTEPAEVEKVDPYSLDDVPHLGPVKIKALKQLGKITTLQVIHKNPVWLKEVTGMDIDQAGEAFAYMRKKLMDAKIIDQNEMSATEALALRQTVKRIRLDCKPIDHILGGGVEAGCVTQIFGEEGGGKTQFSHTLAVQVQRSVEDGGLYVEGGAPSLVIYLDTEDTFRPERIVTILAGKKLIKEIPTSLKVKVRENKIMKPEEIEAYQLAKEEQKKEAEKYLDNIIVFKLFDAQAQCSKINEIGTMFEHVPIKLIIVDSGTALFRKAYLGRGNTKGKFDLMNEMIADLRAIAELNKVPVLFVNQIYNAPDISYGGDPDEPYGGHVLGHAVTYSYKIEKSGGKRKLKIIKSPYQANDECKFMISESGMSDIE